MADDSDEARARALALLEATHEFPCDYSLTVIAISRESTADELIRVMRHIEESPSYSARPSAGGKYVSHKFSVRVSAAGQVLELYELVKTVEGVVTVL